MRVAVAYKAGQPLVLEDLPVPAIGPRDVLVRVTASGICHTDLNVINGLSALPLPIVPGHEGCGIVEETGPEVRRVSVRRPRPRLGHPGVRHLLVVRQRHVQPLRAEPGGEGRAPVRARHRPAGRRGLRLRDVRRGHGGARGVGGTRPDRPRRRRARPPRLRRHHRPGRGPQHRRRRPGFQRGRDRLRRRRPVGDPGRAHRRRRGHHRRRPGARPPRGGRPRRRHPRRGPGRRGSRRARCGR